MSPIPDSDSFVLLRLGERRFAVAAVNIAELVAPSRIFRFPHRTKEIEGVILRRGRIVPVCDVAAKHIGANLLPAGPSDSPQLAGWLPHDAEVIELLNPPPLPPGPAPAPAAPVP